MKPYYDIAGVVLAGGKSSRFGSDKAMAPVDGVPMVARVANELSKVCGAGVVISGNPSQYAELGYPTVPDKYAELGPMGGIVSTLGIADAPFTLFVPCDMPNITAKLLAQLAKYI